MKKLSLFANTNKASESAPDFRLVASYQDAEGNWVNETVGSFWRNQSDNPNAPKLSGKMSEAREFNGKQYPGYKIAVDGVAPQATPQSAPVDDMLGAQPITEPQPPAPDNVPISPDDDQSIPV